jgi:hypothetical protein
MSSLSIRELCVLNTYAARPPAATVSAILAQPCLCHARFYSRRPDPGQTGAARLRGFQDTFPQDRTGSALATPRKRQTRKALGEAALARFATPR